ncbi:hypothetical protein [Nocardioides marmoribigeumensis]|jgi:hypothetical protein|uniref:Uncharacterized protein n=1 Tax=Nocardioides marmoribigeumensis TaxID=433649 RepID=A0ABU2BVG1_9ACTN|nr:hypothetical protein [Nocardioides marmoribigeumensis]MDR7362617.1 hypothetical protein [Nocardioides marmoribigeumensis]
MNPMALYAVMTQQPSPSRSMRDGVVVKRRSRRPSRRTASRSII